LEEEEACESHSAPIKAELQVDYLEPESDYEEHGAKVAEEDIASKDLAPLALHLLSFKS